MRRDARALLWDVRQSCQHIEQFLQDVELDFYLQNALVRSAVERQLQVIGEALSQLARASPDMASRVPNYQQVIAFRNVLVHAYASLDHRQVWRATHESLPRCGVPPWPCWLNSNQTVPPIRERHLLELARRADHET